MRRGLKSVSHLRAMRSYHPEYPRFSTMNGFPSPLPDILTTSTPLRQECAPYNPRPPTSAMTPSTSHTDAPLPPAPPASPSRSVTVSAAILSVEEEEVEEDLPVEGPA
ncbi:hypothetical protein E2C01_020419 [Portunus trituberculatus]|uniref:Uncharacterized protein n=1 Tax=Portunus trituberculatus TaxID=210409 RepID=A0A5B7DZT8_PORTR|nr:hypothetical protein [Portunus trituberculatus]